MGKYSISLKANISGVTNLHPEDGDHYYYMIRLQCTHCREIHPNWIGVAKSDEFDVPGSRGSANLLFKCKNCRRDCNIVLETDFQPYLLEHSETKRPIVTMECRGCEPVEFRPDGNWACDGAETRSKFNEMDITDEWYEYDEETKEEVSITDISWTIDRA
ncbi:putative Eukaryotic protein of unknown function (DUF866) [Blattamonas nauphoetae]|uniref:DUF866-domain-containing protein n=1 Tax=Blattamonas nauphoetae TaxID=2049346 RepID=A0ABQ9X2Q5_9EUKA|nr:putative Eukaryotic protein of unknown function (DUF866) [Blattamonas nauphoetae]